MRDGSIESTPMASPDELWYTDNDMGESTDIPYKQAICSLQYLAKCTRPDILFSINLLGRLCKKPKTVHWEAILDIMRYLNGTSDNKIKLSCGDLNIKAYSDADWANIKIDRSSTSG